jgi:hypothetical protein
MPKLNAEPAEIAAAIERGIPVPDGPGDRYSGYAVLGVPFRSGDVLALRRFPVSSRGCGYTSVWHRTSDGCWTLYADVGPDQGCLHYFGRAVDHAIHAPIRIEWTGARSLQVAVNGGRLLAWSLSLAPTTGTTLVNTVAAVLPAWAWTDRRALAAIGVLARLALRSGRLRLTGTTPCGSRFLATPRMMWSIVASRATIAGHDLGPVGIIDPQASLGEFLIPRRPLFAVGSAFMVPDGS